VDTFWSFCAVCLGSALGGGARFLVAVASAKLTWFGKDFHPGTWFVNVAGCFLITLILGIATATSMPTNLRLFLTTGFLGGLTTYSTFDYEVTRFFQEGATWLGIAYLTATVLGCFLAGLGGVFVSRAIVGAPSGG
jgi:CrcB protein